MSKTVVNSVWSTTQLKRRKPLKSPHQDPKPEFSWQSVGSRYLAEGREQEECVHDGGGSSFRVVGSFVGLAGLFGADHTRVLLGLTRRALAVSRKKVFNAGATKARRVTGLNVDRKRPTLNRTDRNNVRAACHELILAFQRGESVEEASEATSWTNRSRQEDEPTRSPTLSQTTCSGRYRNMRANA